jgi:hypothetical protein
MKYLIVKPMSGLGNRLRALLSANRLARLMGRQLGVIWTLDNYHCYCAFNALFQNDFFFTSSHFLTQRAVKSYRIEKKPTRIADSNDEVIFVEAENFIWSEQDQGIVFGQFPPSKVQNQQLAAELLTEFEALKPVECIVNAVNSFVEENFQHGSIGVHIRREDNYWSNTYCPDVLFFNKLHEVTLSYGGKIFLATDSTETEQRFREYYGQRIVTYPVRSLARGSSPESIIDALIIMLIMARTKILLRSCSSSYSQCASWFGKVPTIEIGKLEHAS